MLLRPFRAILTRSAPAALSLNFGSSFGWAKIAKPLSMQFPLPFQVRFVAFAFASLLATTLSAHAATSVWVYPGPSGRLLSRPDFQGNRIPDSSGVGYKSSAVPLPSPSIVPVRTNISPVIGDNTGHIQSAINYVSGLPLDTNGFRGAVLLSAGEYACASTINIKASGVVLRGVSSNTNG